MDKTRRLLITFFALILLVAVLYFFTSWFSRVTGYFSGESEQERIVECLVNKNAELYGSKLCANCEKQKEIIGKSLNRITYIDCGNEKENCPNIRSVPAWYIDQEIYYGLKSLDELKTLSNC